MKKQTVKMGMSILEKKMTDKQALRYGYKKMDKNLKGNNFKVVLYRATQNINGWDGIRINFGK